jgi:hypothetical protein
VVFAIYMSQHMMAYPDAYKRGLYLIVKHLDGAVLLDQAYADFKSWLKDEGIADVAAVEGRIIDETMRYIDRIVGFVTSSRSGAAPTMVYIAVDGLPSMRSTPVRRTGGTRRSNR